MRQLLLIKHSLPEFLENVPAREWHLSAEGRHRCQDLARIVAPYAPQTVVSSLELKAQETGQLLAGFLQLPFSTAENLHEHERRNTPFSGQEEFEANILRLFQNPGQRVMGEETADEAHARFAEAVRGVLEAHPTGHLAIVAHGTVISLYVSRLAGMEPYPLWKRLGLPSMVVLSMPENRVEKIIENVLEVA